MNKREDDFQEQAEQYADDVWKEDEDIEQKCITMTDYFAGAKYGYQYAVDKVCAFLEKYAANFVALPDEGQQPIGDTNAIYGTKSLLYYLHKAMED